MNYATYRIGKAMHEPRDKKIGNEISEETELSFGDFITNTEKLIGNYISVIWFSSKPMPKKGMCFTK